MRQCANCGHQNPDHIDFCLNCAATLGQHCPACGQPVPAGNKFCGQCGARLPEAAAPPPATSRQSEVLQSLRAMMPPALAEKITATAPQIIGERREVTVVFVDVLNFTAAAHSLDSEEVYLFVDEAMRLFVDVIYKYEGTIDKFTGDGLMALFGAPVAHENDPERAVRAALEMQTVLQPVRERVRQKHGFDLQVRIGINTGLVVAGQVGGDLHMEYTVIGDTVNLAARLEAAADPGAILASFATYQRTRPFFQYRAPAPLFVKGIAEPVRVFQPIGVLAKPGRVRGLAGMEVPMIGRQNALARLHTALETVIQQRRCQVALITGEAGLGKSRLVAEFRQTVTQPQVKVFEGSCIAYTRSQPLWIVTELFRNILHLSETGPPGRQYQAIQAYLSGMGLRLDDVLPYLANLLGLAQSDPAMEARLQQLDASMLQRQTHAALRQILLAEALRDPTVLVFDDLHWVDVASRDFLEYLIQSTGDAPLLLILISRDSERKTVIRSLIATAEKNADQLLDIQLQPLSLLESQLLLDQLLPGATGTLPPLKQRIAERADGNPFFIEEIVRMLIDQGGLIREVDAWQVSPRVDELMQDVPGTLKGLILARFDRLPEGPRQMLQKAAVLGRSFPVGLLQMLDRARAAHLGTDFAELATRQFLIAEPFGAEAGYAFRHALVQEAVYNTLLKRDRQRIHEQIAQTIETGAFWPPEEQTEVLAHHYAESNTPSRAVPYLIAAAESAARRYANEIAIHHYRRAIALMQEPAMDRQTELTRARVGLGQALKFVGEYAEARQVLLEAVEDLQKAAAGGHPDYAAGLAESLRELANVRQQEGMWDEALTNLESALTVLGEAASVKYPALWSSLLDRMAWVHFRQGRLDEAFVLASQATTSAPELVTSSATLASLYNTLGGVAWQRGELDQAINYVERSLNLYQGLGYSWGMANAYTNLGILYSSLGQWPKAVENFEKSDILRREIGYLPGRAINLKNLAELRLSIGDHAQAEKDLETSVALSRRLGEDYATLHGELTLARLAILQSRLDDAGVHLDAAEDLLKNAGEDQTIQFRLLQAQVQAERGHLQEAISLSAEVLQQAHSAGLLEEEADSHRVAGLLRARIGDWKEAESELRESFTLSVQHNYPYRKGQALLELGHLYQRWGRQSAATLADGHEKARQAYHDAREIFDKLGATYDLQMVEAALNQLALERGAESSPTADQIPEALARSWPASPKVPEGEWRLAAVVWLNLSPRPEVDDETAFETLALVMPLLVSVIRDQQGYLIQRPSGLTAVFGAQVAHEDDAERAVHTARRMLEHLRQFEAAGEARLTAKLTVSYGQVLAGYIGPQAKADFVMTGEPIQLAQRVAEAALPGRVWVTQAVHDATLHAFAYQAPAAEESAQLTDVPVWELVKALDKPGLARGLPGTTARFIGREAPFEAMVDLAENLKRGRGALVWVEGEAGIGKSRLMREFSAFITTQGAVVWIGQCYPQRSGHAFSLISNLLANVFGLQGTDTPEQIVEKMKRTISLWPPEAQTTQPYLELLVGVRPAGLEGERLASLEPDQLRQQVFIAIRSLLKAQAASQPLVALLDDLHWVDPISADLLLFLSNLVASLPILFVGALRWDETEAIDDRLVNVLNILNPDQTLRLYLDRLSETETEALLSELLSAKELSPALRTLALERSEGNPYYLEEIIRALMERGYLERRQDRWDIESTVNLQEMPLPTSLEALIHSRIDSLPADLKLLLQCAAVIGGTFEDHVLEEVWGSPDIRAALNRLGERGMLRRATQPSRWQFSHSLIELTVYNSMLKARRKALHLRVAEVLERYWAGAEATHAAELAHHFTQAEAWKRALTYLVLAANHAAERYANEEALVYYQQARQLLATQPAADIALRWRIAAGLGDVYRFIGEFDESRAALEEGLALLGQEQLTPSQRAGLYRRLGETAQKQGDFETSLQCFDKALSYLDPAAGREAQVEAARVFAGQAWTHLRQGHLDQARQACETGLRQAQLAGSLKELAITENTLGGIYYQLGELEQALQHTRQAMLLREKMGDTSGVAATSSNLGILATLAGDWGQAMTLFQRSLALRDEIGDVEGVAIIQNNLGTLLRDQGELDPAESHFRKSLALATSLKMAYHLANTSMGLAEVLLQQGQIEAAQTTLNTSVTQAELIGAKDLLSEISRVQAQILLQQSAWQASRQAAQKAADLANEIGDRNLEAAAWRTLSSVELLAGRPQAAREAIGQAWKALAGVISQLEAGRVAAQAGHLSLSEGEMTQAEKYLHDARTIFAYLGARLDLKRVETTLDQLHNRKSSAPTVT